MDVVAQRSLLTTPYFDAVAPVAQVVLFLISLTPTHQLLPVLGLVDFRITYPSFLILPCRKCL